MSFWILTCLKSCSYGVMLEDEHLKIRRDHVEGCKWDFKGWKCKLEVGRQHERLVLESKHTLVQHIGFIVQARLILVEVFPPHSAKTKESWSYEVTGCKSSSCVRQTSTEDCFNWHVPLFERCSPSLLLCIAVWLCQRCLFIAVTCSSENFLWTVQAI